MKTLKTVLVFLGLKIIEITLISAAVHVLHLFGSWFMQTIDSTKWETEIATMPIWGTYIFTALVGLVVGVFMVLILIFLNYVIKENWYAAKRFVEDK